MNNQNPNQNSNPNPNVVHIIEIDTNHLSPIPTRSLSPNSWMHLQAYADYIDSAQHYRTILDTYKVSHANWDKLEPEILKVGEDFNKTRDERIKLHNHGKYNKFLSEQMQEAGRRSFLCADKEKKISNLHRPIVFDPNNPTVSTDQLINQKCELEKASRELESLTTDLIALNKSHHQVIDLAEQARKRNELMEKIKAENRKNG